MKIKIKYPHSKGHLRMENEVYIQEVFIKENILSTKGESIALGFNNKNSSGLIEMTSEEFDKLVKTVRNKIHLVKGVKVFKEFKENKEDEEIKALRREAE